MLEGTRTGVGARAAGGVEEEGVGVEEEGVEVSDGPQALALRVPRKVIV